MHGYYEKYTSTSKKIQTQVDDLDITALKKCKHGFFQLLNVSLCHPGPVFKCGGGARNSCPTLLHTQTRNTGKKDIY